MCLTRLPTFPKSEGPGYDWYIPWCPKPFYTLREEKFSVVYHMTFKGYFMFTCYKSFYKDLKSSDDFVAQQGIASNLRLEGVLRRWPGHRGTCSYYALGGVTKMRYAFLHLEPIRESLGLKNALHQMLNLMQPILFVLLSSLNQNTWLTILST